MVQLRFGNLQNVFLCDLANRYESDVLMEASWAFLSDTQVQTTKRLQLDFVRPPTSFVVIEMRSSFHGRSAARHGTFGSLWIWVHVSGEVRQNCDVHIANTLIQSTENGVIIIIKPEPLK